MPEGVSEAEFVSFYATVINRIAYASLEEPTIDRDEQVSFHITWCPHQDHYSAFDCRVQRYLVQGMLDAVREQEWFRSWQVRFTQTIPAGADTCRFTIWRGSEEEKSAWAEYTRQLEVQALPTGFRGKGVTIRSPGGPARDNRWKEIIPKIRSTKSETRNNTK